MDIGLTIHQLRFTLEATEPLELEQQPGSSLRGAIFHALLRRFCALPQQPECSSCQLIQTCPVAALVAPLRDETPRGRDVPRPFVLRPPLVAAQQNGLRLVSGQRCTFELALIGGAAKLFPYVVLSAQVMESNGLGRPLRANSGRRGRFIVAQIDAEDGFNNQVQRLYIRGEQQVQTPTFAATEEQVADRATSLPADRLMVRFLTPTRLISDGKLVRTPDPAILTRRLAERLDALEREYVPVPTGATSDGESSPYGRWHAVAQSCNLRLTSWDGAWVDTQSYSTRQHKRIPIGGFVGTATFAGTLSPALRELLVWGELVHVGKNAVKGDGWYQIVAE
jgi:hypothetical protein